MKAGLIFLLVLFSCNRLVLASPEKQVNAAFAKADEIDNFWKWFIKNEKRLRNFQTDPDKYLNELFVEVKKIRSGLAIEFEPPKNGIINLTVSANGNVELFQLVREIVERAPLVKGWKIIAFRQRMTIAAVKGMKLKVDDVILEPEQMKFFPVVENNQLNVIIYATGVTEKNYQQVAYACFILLDNILGEYDCVTKVKSFDFQPLPTDKGELADLKPLLELATYVDSYYSGKR